jgi:lipopolysaccharide/colanic/teichoic acid biosynthesis glycosyltransferase
MPLSKRLFDIILALFLLVVLAPVICLVGVIILVRDGRPVFYLSERMKTPTQSFTLWKFRTMTKVAEDGGVSGGDKTARITPLGAALRRKRLDELPQLLNILSGDLSFVGPRPPLRRYVDICPQTYAEVLKHRPGVTGLATIRYHRTEEKLLAECVTPEQTERVYLHRCVPAKARLDLIWSHNWSLCFDLKLIIETAVRVFLKR